MRIPHLKTIGIRRPTTNRATFPAEAEEETFPAEAEEVADQEAILPTLMTSTTMVMMRPASQVTGEMT